MSLFEFDIYISFHSNTCFYERKIQLRAHQYKIEKKIEKNLTSYIKARMI